MSEWRVIARHALTLRRKVGSAKAAKAARAGKPTSKARSSCPVSQALARVTPMNHSGRLRCGFSTQRQH